MLLFDDGSHFLVECSGELSVEEVFDDIEFSFLKSGIVSVCDNNWGGGYDSIIELRDSLEIDLPIKNLTFEFDFFIFFSLILFTNNKKIHNKKFFLF